MTGMRRWRVLLLSTGYDKRALRRAVLNHLNGLGFEGLGYEAAYPVDYEEHSHIACLKALPDCDVAVAVIDKAPGGRFARSALDPEMLNDLIGRKILADGALDTATPTILQVEILLARSLQKPVVILAARELESAAKLVIDTIVSSGYELVPLNPRAPDLNVLIRTKDWWRLHENYEVRGCPVNFGQCAFFERIRREPPNWVTMVEDVFDVDALKGVLSLRLADVVLAFFPDEEWIQARVDRKRDPIGIRSVGDLLRRGEVVSPPYRVVSGSASGQPLVTVDGETGIMGPPLAGQGNILLLGQPGLGKSTVLLQLFYQLQAHSGLEQSALHYMYVSLRELSNQIDDDGAFVREAVGLVNSRAPWPAAVGVPDVHMAFVLDGLDEWAMNSASSESILNALAHRGPIVVSCRSGEFARQLDVTKSLFDSILELVPWEARHVQKYVTGLRARGWDRAAEYVEANREGFDGELFGFPLWLSMITYLLRPQVHEHDVPLDSLEILRRCAWAVASDECARHGISTEPSNIERLASVWCECAWRVQVSRRRHELPPKLDDIFVSVGIDSPSWKAAVQSALDTDERLHGFFHEVFFEYWLAEAIRRRIGTDLSGQSRASAIEALSIQRSAETNQILRGLIRLEGLGDAIALTMRDAFGELFGGDVFVKNQLIYFAGRLSGTESIRKFLRSVWYDEGEDVFVRLSAAFAVIPLGEIAVEEDLVERLRLSADWGAINRGYHLFYYRDIDLAESALPYKDDGSSPGEHTIKTLVVRLRRDGERGRSLRRVELRTLAGVLRTREGPIDGQLLDLATLAAGDVANEIAALLPDRGAAVGVELAELVEAVGFARARGGLV